MVLKRSAVAEFLDRGLDDFRWMKGLSRDRMLADLEGLRIRPRFKTEPWLHQLVCFYIGLTHPRFMWLLDMGAGKSKIILDLLTQRLREGRVDRGLVTVPRLSNISSWVDAAAAHSDLEPWPINIPDIEEKRERLLNPKGDFTVIDIQGLQWALCNKEKVKGQRNKALVRDDKLVRQLLKRYNFLDLDEVHKFISQDSLWFSLMNQVSKGMDYVYGNTGTIFGKHVETMWTPFYLVDRGETLGETLGMFRAAFFDAKMNPWKGHIYTFRKSMEDDLHRVLQHRSIRYEENELAELPKAVALRRNVEMGEEQREHYLRALEGLINAGGSLRELEGQYVRMRQIISGYLAWKDETGSHVHHFAQNPKLDDLESLVDECTDAKSVVVYWYTETGTMIVERLRALGHEVEWLYGGTKDHEALRRRFLRKDRPGILVMQADAGGTGQDGLQEVARYMFFYETPTSPVDRKQTSKRIHRPGQTKRTFFYDLVMRRSMDQGILDDIAQGIDAHKAIADGKRRSRGFFLA